MNRWSTRLALLTMPFLLLACEGKMSKLKPGVSTGYEVRDVMGKPEMEWKNPDGSVTWEYPKGPQGLRTYMIVIGPDHVMREMHQVLSQETFDKVRKGMSRADIRRLLGKPFETVTFPLKKEEVWSWRYERLNQEAMQFHVHFNLDGEVVTTSRTMEQQG